MEYFDDDRSYDFVDWKEFCISESDREDSSAETEPHNNEIDSSDLDSSDEVDMVEGFMENIGKQEEVYMPEFPAHIKRRELMQIRDVVRHHVLPFLPAKSLARFRAVSKDWAGWISSPFLAHMQSYLFQNLSGFFCQYSYNDPTFIPLNGRAHGTPSPSLNFLPEPVFIRSSCNGLLLCQGRDYPNSYYVCNPANKEWRVLPQPVYYHRADESNPLMVLAFEPSVLNMDAHFEVVCAFSLIDEGYEAIVLFEIYSSREGCWRLSTADCVELGDSLNLKDGFYMNGTAYWEALWSGEVLAFNVRSEVCGVLSLPQESKPGRVLCGMRGELCCVQAYHVSGGVFVIEIYRGTDMSLKRGIEVSLEHVLGMELFGEECRVLPYVSGGDVVVFLVGSVVCAYHVSEEKVEVICSGGECSGARCFPYVNSLVSLVS